MSTKITKDVATELDARRIAVGTTATSLAMGGFKCKRGIRIKAKIDNAVLVYIGPADLTAGTAVATDGYPLAAGEELALPVEDPALVFARLPSGTGDVWVIAV